MYLVRSSLVRNVLSISHRKRVRIECCMKSPRCFFSTLNSPLSEISSSSDAPLMRKGMSVYDRGVEDWSQWYSAAEYINPWDTAFRESPLDFAKQYDYMTQHVMSLLQSFHQFDANSVTTEICNVLLHKLRELLPAASTTSSSSKQKDNENDAAHVSHEETVSRSTRVAAGRLPWPCSKVWNGLNEKLPCSNNNISSNYNNFTAISLRPAFPAPFPNPFSKPTIRCSTFTLAPPVHHTSPALRTFWSRKWNSATPSNKSWT
jgi:hypothetical protein